jgi:hypothetical protein
MKPSFFFVSLPLIAASLVGCSYSSAPGGTSSSSAAASLSSAATSIASSVQTRTDIMVSQPAPRTRVTSPLAVAGQAEGTWFFEAVFPVKLLDGNGATIAQGQARAQGNWMTPGLVPFTATLTFTAPSTPNGSLVLEKDNPSGLPQNAASLTIPVQF